MKIFYTTDPINFSNRFFTSYEALESTLLDENGEKMKIYKVSIEEDEDANPA